MKNSEHFTHLLFCNCTMHNCIARTLQYFLKNNTRHIFPNYLFDILCRLKRSILFCQDFIFDANGGKGHIEGLLRALSIVREASVVQCLCHSPCTPGVAGSIPGFSSPSDGTVNRGPVSI